MPPTSPSSRWPLCRLACALLALLAMPCWHAHAQFIEHEERDRRHLVPRSPDTGTPHKVGLFTHLAEIGPVCKVSRSSAPAPLPRAPKDLLAVRYSGPFFSSTLREHIDKHQVMGLMLLRDGRIIEQQLRFERRETDLFTSFSVAKSIISILIGIALDEGLIQSLDDPVSRYTHRIDDSSYSQVSIRSLLRMSSGIPFDENYSGRSDIHDFDQALRFSADASVVRTLNGMRRPSIGPGRKFNYASVETTVLAEVLGGATGRSVCQFMQEKLWEPLGAEHDAWWSTDSQGNVLGFAFFNATQTDYARLGLMLAQMGQFNGRRILSASYIDEATNVERQPDGFRFNQAQWLSGYGYQFWLREKPGRYFMQGLYGQYIGIDRDSRSVLVIHAADNVGASSLRSVSTYRLFQSLIQATDPP